VSIVSVSDMSQQGRDPMSYRTRCRCAYAKHSDAEATRTEFMRNKNGRAEKWINGGR